MKITILCPNLSNNCLSRAYFLAKVLQRRYKVEIVGPFFGDGIWSPVAGDRTVVYKPVDCRFFMAPIIKAREILEKIEGDVIYVSKPLLTSLGVALLYRRIKPVPVILDVEDWQLGFYEAFLEELPFLTKVAYVLYSALFFYKTNSFFNSWFMEKFISRADDITVANTYLKNRFGGELIEHARDTEKFDPGKFNRDLIREEMDITPEKKVIMFLGTPRAHKGLDDLVKAVNIMKDRSIVLMVAGLTGDRYCRKFDAKAKNILGERYVGIGIQPFHKVPELLVAADIVAIPQRKSSATVGQIPARVFEAMAMAKPVVATDVSDMRDILSGCGWVVEPENPGAMAEALEDVLHDPERAEETGRQARLKCIEKYNWDAASSILLKIFARYE